MNPCTQYELSENLMADLMLYTGTITLTTLLIHSAIGSQYFDLAISNIEHLPYSSSYIEGTSGSLDECAVAASMQRTTHTAAQLCPVILCSILKDKLKLNTEYACKLLLIYTASQLQEEQCG